MLVPGPHSEGPRARTPVMSTVPPGQRGSVGTGGGDGETEEESGRRDGDRDHLILPGPQLKGLRQPFGRTDSADCPPQCK